MKHVPSCRTLALTTAATGTLLAASALGVLPAVAATDATGPVPATTVASSSAPDTTAAGSAASSGATAPSYAPGAGQFPSAPKVLPTVRAGSAFSADLRARDAAGATYTLTTPEGTPAQLDDGVTFTGGVLSGTPTYAGTSTLLVRATTTHGTTTEWVRLTVEPAPTTGVGVVVRGLPGAAADTYTWVADDGTVYPDPISVPSGTSITLVPWTKDAYDNTLDAVRTADVTTNGDADRVARGADGIALTLTDGGTHTVRVSVAGVETSFPVTVAGGATPAAAAPAAEVTPAAVAAPVAERTTTTADDELASTGTDVMVPIGWAAGLLAVGTVLVGLYRARRSRHRA